MKLKALAILSAVILLCPQNLQAAEEHYDPQHTVLALNMAVVSIQRILNTNDRAVLEMEYRNIINNLKLGSIEADPEIIALYQELMNTISGKLLSREEAEKLQKDYDEWQRMQMLHATLSIAAMGLRASATNPVTFGAKFVASCTSSYFAYQGITKYFRDKLNDKLREIDVKEREIYNTLQTRLLNSSWRLMRQYHLPDEYRITQDDVSDLFRAVNEEDSSKSLSMLRALENDFRIFPPYWVYRARSAQNAGQSQEAAKCFEEFGKVWRPVLRNDPFRLEAAKYYVQEALKLGNNSEALTQLAIVRENTARSDWADNLFAGVVYYVLGNKDEAVRCAELNINFGAEKEVSGVVIAQMKDGKLDAESLPAELRKILGLNKLNYETLVSLAENGDLEAQLTLGKMYMDGGITFGLGKIYEEGEITSKDYAVAQWLYVATR
ncbi:MAG: hypothetical protein IJQ24_09925, partial [Synergistaceae bacterium]|nr:hypothetical protein [Synergistaceae bacterium]